MRLAEPTEYLTISLSPAFLSAARCESEPPPNTELENHYAVTDKYIEGTCLSLREEVLHGGASGTLYAESVALALAAHLLHRYSRGSASTKEDCGNVSSHRIRQAVAFINERLGKDISLSEIAASVNLSPFHFARVFKQNMGIAPHQFVIQQRMEKAKTLLTRSNTPIAEVAQELGFADQSHFTSQFRRRCGMTPQQFINFSGGRKVTHYVAAPIAAQSA